MDSELARTFLAIITTGNFTTAAELLHITQSTVSARIRTLERILDCELFVRNKSGTHLTPQGIHFQKYATRIVHTVEQAKQEIGTPAGYMGSVTIGGRFGLWEYFLLQFMQDMRREHPDLSVRAEIGFEDDLMQKLIDRRLDVGVMYTPHSRPGFKVEQLFDEHLVMVSSKRTDRSRIADNYVYVDWGPEFYQRHEINFPGLHNAGIVAGVGWIGLQHILGAGGAGYFPIRSAKSYISAGKLFIVEDTPEFILPTYAVYSKIENPPYLENVMRIMRDIARRPI